MLAPHSEQAAAMRIKVAPAVAAGQWLARIAAALLFALPIALALPLAVGEGLASAAWQDLMDDPQWPRALMLSVQTALLSTSFALALTLWLVAQLHASRWWTRLGAGLAPLLAVPHAAFAIGMAWLIAPAGWAARLIAPWLGWDAPPAWTTVNDAQGLALVAVLVFKELPFLLWSALALLTRPEVAATLSRDIMVARSLGYTARSWWWRVGWLWWAPRLAWPLLAVLAYSLTVVDLALIIGPGAPPTLAVLAWQGLSDGNVARNAQGAAMALLLGAVLAALVFIAWLLWRAVAPLWRARSTRGDRPRVAAREHENEHAKAHTQDRTNQQARQQAQLPQQPHRPRAAMAVVLAVLAVYGAVVVSIVVMSIAGVWRFPALWPQLSASHWQTVFESAGTVAFTAALAFSAAAAALALTVAWLEAAPARWDATLTPLVLAPLVLPQLLLMVGLYRGALWLGLDGTWLGLWWVHLLMLLPYVFTALAPSWRSFDARYALTALTLRRSRLAFHWRVKWPLLAAPLASALAIAFAVSVAQYLSTQFIGAGRHATLTTEAVTLASGGQRSLAAAFALLQAVLPALGFALAYAVGRRKP